MSIRLREAFPFDTAPNYLIFDRDAIFSTEVARFIKAMGIKPMPHCLPQSLAEWRRVAERWIGSCRRALLDHVIVFDRHHFIRLMRSYLDYYHEDRCHLGLAKDTPSRRVVASRPFSSAKIVALPRVGGLHHRHAWPDAA